MLNAIFANYLYGGNQ